MVNLDSAIIGRRLSELCDSLAQYITNDLITYTCLEYLCIKIKGHLDKWRIRGDEDYKENNMKILLTYSPCLHRLRVVSFIYFIPLVSFFLFAVMFCYFFAYYVVLLKCYRVL